MAEPEDIEREVVKVPSLKDTPETFRQLFRMHSLGKARHVSLDLSECKWLSHAGIAFLVGCVASHRGQFMIDWETVSPRILKQFLQHFDWLLEETSDGAVAQHSVPPRMFAASDQKVVEYLTKDWLGPGWVQVSEKLTDRLAGRTYEIFVNAWEHSGAKSVFCCGEHSERWKTLKLTIVDFGVGIPALVRPYVREHMNRDPSDAQCLRWAMQKGATTTNQMPRGLGLDLLRDMVEATNGQLDIYSHSAHMRVNRDRQTVSKFDEFFEGTLVNIMFRCDNVKYRLASERPQEHRVNETLHED